VRTVCLAITMLLTANVLSAAEVFRSVAPDGTVSYSDRPVGEDAETITITTRRPTVTPQAPATTAQQPSEALPAQAAAEPEEPQPTREQIAAEREANCAAARERNDRYQMSRRLYRTLPDGEREYLSDEEIDAARAGAAADVEQWCN